MSFKFLTPAVACLTLGLWLNPAVSQTPKPKGPVVVEADQMEIVEPNKRVIFRGKVDATRDGDHIRSDEMVVDYAETAQADGGTRAEVSNLDATGNVTITTKRQKITGKAAKLNVQTNQLVVTGDVRLVEGKNTVQGQKLAVDLNTEKTVVSGGRVKGSFVPN